MFTLEYLLKDVVVRLSARDKAVCEEFLAEPRASGEEVDSVVAPTAKLDIANFSEAGYSYVPDDDQYFWGTVDGDEFEDPAMGVQVCEGEDDEEEDFGRTVDQFQDPALEEHVGDREDDGEREALGGSPTREPLYGRLWCVSDFRGGPNRRNHFASALKYPDFHDYD